VVSEPETHVPEAVSDPAAPGPGWWLASDGNYYAPELHPDYVPPVHGAAPPISGPGAGAVLAAQQPGGWRGGITSPPPGFHGAADYRPPVRDDEDFFAGRQATHRGPQQAPQASVPGYGQYPAQGYAPGAPQFGTMPVPPQRRRGWRGKKLAILIVVLVVLIAGAVVAVVALSGSSTATPAQDRADAVHIELALSDLPPGWSVASAANSSSGSSGSSPSGDSGTTPAGCSSIKSRLDSLNTGNVRSAANTGSKFQADAPNGTPQLQLSDGVLMLSSSPGAARAFQGLRSFTTPTGLACLQSIVTSAAVADGATATATATSTSLHVSGANVSALAVLLNSSVTGRQITVPVNAELVFVKAQRAVLMLEYNKIAAGPVDQGFVTALVQKMVDRSEQYAG
jgi:hypothetical protein